MNRETFERIKNFTVKGKPLHKIASWAIWDQSDLNNTAIIDTDASIEKLNPNIVFMGLNFSGDALIVDDPKWTPWQNFHSTSRMDKRLAKVLRGSQYEGAYMSDIVKYVPTRNGKELVRKVKNGVVDMEEQVKMFIDEINILNSNSIKLILMGRDAEWLFNEYVKKSDQYGKIKDKIAEYKEIPHPSPWVSFWENNINEVLGIKG